ncbi:MAG: Na+/H+ antiporter subunit E [Deltaproteobacteria bacterium]|nr:Na+/H+ antiporter subunit E [Deltaproteobacteria bacterium]MBW2049052.1 Na+/H+ antiporter subunit E [Deltaproteobacteria bacterium]MBW2111012.1 Na+/H+ antiporter subunit E [Deltaproteobacteria bacterium]MBW2353183.1 Na+/H+ antiporter subunit E [Deltaproteobacteria bacterium]HDZ89241.1 cation transporter [Deltaproteobacteria bacterium]
MAEESRVLRDKKCRAIFTGAQRRKTRFHNFMGTAIILFIFWSLLSGHFDLFHLVLGAVCSLAVSYLFHDLLFVNVRIGNLRTMAWRFLIYIPWLLGQILIANMHVAALVLRPKMPISPRIIRFKTKLETDISKVTLANSITLTPGTITIDIRGDEFYVHALSHMVADDLYGGEMEDRVAHIFMEGDHLYLQDALDAARIYETLGV